MCKAFDEIRKEGEEIGEIRFAALSIRLLNNCRLDDLAKAASDKLFRNKLYQEFQLLS